MTGFPLTSYDDGTHALIEESGFVDENEYSENPDIYLRGGPVLYAGEFSIAENLRINDTYIDTSGWGKVSLFVSQAFVHVEIIFFCFRLSRVFCT